MSSKPLPRQPEINIGTLGHVDNGKSTLVQALTGIWTARHSEELKRGITIRIGYADMAVYECPLCEEPFNYKLSEVCPRHGVETRFVRAVSFIDCPGHHSLMITMLSGAALFDGALFVIDARQKFPQPQDREHFEAAKIMGVKNLIFVQNKVDLITRERALENYEEVKSYVADTPFADSPIIPVSAQHALGIETLIYAMEKTMPTPPRELQKPFQMPVLRSFDVNLPGTLASKISGGVIGGSIIQGKVKIGDEIEIAPGLPVKENDPKSPYEPIYTTVRSIRAGGKAVDEAMSGGLVGIETGIDPSFTKADSMAGNIAGRPGTLPPVWRSLQISYTLFKKVVGVEGEMEVKPISEKEPLVINIYSAVTSCVVVKRTSEILTVELSKPICAKPGDKVTISRRIGAGWRLIGYGKIVQ
ncbi:MAG: translation initiation factor IF-2 subunit gamma [Nitrososphaerota archaeon]